MQKSWRDARDKRCRELQKEGRHPVPSDAARFRFRRLPAPALRRPGAQRKNAFPNGSGIYGARTMAADVLDKATRYALLSSCPLFLPSHPLIPMYLVSLRTGLNNFLSSVWVNALHNAPRRLNSQTTLVVGILEANLQGSLRRDDHPG